MTIPNCAHIFFMWWKSRNSRENKRQWFICIMFGAPVTDDSLTLLLCPFISATHQIRRVVKFFFIICQLCLQCRGAICSDTDQLVSSPDSSAFLAFPGYLPAFFDSFSQFCRWLELVLNKRHTTTLRFLKWSTPKIPSTLIAVMSEQQQPDTPNGKPDSMIFFTVEP